MRQILAAVVLCLVAAMARAQTDTTLTYQGRLIQNGNPDAVALLYIQAIADAVSYEGSTNGFTEGSGDGLEDLATALRGIGRYVDGVDTDQNNADFSVQCVTPGEPNVSISQYCGLPADLSVSNIGCVGYNDAVYDDYLDTYSVTSICGHVYGGQDQVTFVGKETCGDAQIMARIAGVFMLHGQRNRRRVDRGGGVEPEHAIHR